MNTYRTQRTGGFTLVELLVVIAIIGVLVALLLPAVQAAREAARRAQCANNLRQVALGWQLHHDAHKFFPSGGWGWIWVGDADRGYGKKQPGGWAYSIMPFLEQQALHDLPKDGNADTITAPQKTGAARAMQLPVLALNCPTRRGMVLQPQLNGGSNVVNADPVDRVIKADYVANGGPRRVGWGTGPTSMAQALSNPAAMNTGFMEFDRPESLGSEPNPDHPSQIYGIAYQRSQISTREVTDGTSNTYMVGEKALRSDRYLDPDFLDTGDDHSMLCGDDFDMFAWGEYVPVQDTPGVYQSWQFGSAHPSVWQMAMCDSSVRALSFDLDATAHKYLSDRQDGNVAPGF